MVILWTIYIILSIVAIIVLCLGLAWLFVYGRK